MSIRFMSAALNVKLPPSQKLVLITLADNAHEDTGEAWPAIKTISAKNYISEATTHRIIKKLKESGLITIKPRYAENGRQRTNMYVLDYEKIILFDKRREARGGCQIDTQGGGGCHLGDRGEGVTLDDTPILTVNIEPSDNNKYIQKENIKRKSTEREKQELFDRWWNMYPNKVGKKHALKSWLKLTIEEMSTCIIAIRAQIQQRRLLDTYKASFIPDWKNPATWINAGSWEDEILTETQIKERAYEAVKRNTYRNEKQTPVQKLRDEQRERMRKRFGAISSADGGEEPFFNNLPARA